MRKFEFVFMSAGDRKIVENGKFLRCYQDAEQENFETKTKGILMLQKYIMPQSL